MKNYIQYLTIGALLMGSLTSCNDFLDREPLDKVTPEKFFSAEADLAAYAINNYKFVTVDDKYGINLLEKIMIQIIRQAEQVIRFGFLVRKSCCRPWRVEMGGYSFMQLLFDQVLPRYEEGAITGNQDNVKHYIGEMYVNRAYSYFQLLQNLVICLLSQRHFPIFKVNWWKLASANRVIRLLVLLLKI